MKNFDFLTGHRGILAISVMLYHTTNEAYNRLMDAISFGVVGNQSY